MRQFAQGLLGLVCAGMLATAQGEGERWQVQPRLSLAEIYTDNVNHEPDATREKDYVTQVIPGISVIRNGPRLNLNLDYQLQGFFYARGTNDDDVYQRLFGALRSEPVPDWLHLDASATIGQTIIDATQNLSVSNLVGKRNRAEVRKFAFSPYLKHEFPGARVLIRTEYQATRYDRGGSDSDARIHQVRLSDAGRSPNLQWSLNYQDQDYDRETANDVRFRNLEAMIRQRLFRRAYFLARAGKADNAYQGVEDRRNGSYWAAGLGWRARRFSIDLLAGDRDEGVALGWTPNARTVVDVEYRNRTVGRVYGPIWRARITHKTRRSMIGFTYNESTQAYEQVSLFTGDRLQAVVQPGSGLIFIDPATGEQIFFTGGEFFSITDQVINRRRGTLSYSYRLARSHFRIALYKELRTEAATDQEQDARGLNASWKWRLGGRTDLLLAYGTQLSKFTPGLRENRYRIFNVGLDRRLGSRSSLGLNYFRASQDNTGSAQDFTENRISLRFTTRF